jgi:ABC-type uncharacterized transport system permease subunit
MLLSGLLRGLGSAYLLLGYVSLFAEQTTPKATISSPGAGTTERR